MQKLEKTHKKTKVQYRSSGRKKIYFPWESCRYPNLRNQIYSYFRTQQERSFHYLHKAEYWDYNIKLRPKRGKHLPHIWDDKPTYAFKYAKSWKHDSKRRHQWYREKDGFREKMQSDYILTD